jgi:ABC-type Fe3+/spermidine/putrescine transport system ATPase subunit
VLRIEGLRFAPPGFTLGPLSLAIERGEYFALLGPSGSGKSTVLEWLAGFRQASAGRLWVDGVEATALAPQHRGLGIVHQDAALFPHMTVRENLAFPLRARGWETSRIDARVRELAELLRVADRLDAYPQEISGGEDHRVALGRALAAGQRLLLLDEPLSGLDPHLRRDLRHELGLLHADLGLTVLHITHHLREARSLADRIGLLVDGEIAQVGTPGEVFAQPASAAVARFLVVPNFLDGVANADAGVVELAPGIAVPAPVTTSGPISTRVRGLRAIAAPTSSTANGGHSASAMLRARVRGYDRARDGRGVLIAELLDVPDRILLEMPADKNSPAPGHEALIDFSEASWDIY